MSETDEDARKHLAQFNDDARKVASVAPMTAPTPEQMRGMAEALDGEARMFRTEDVVIERQSADMLRAAAEEVDRLRAVIENALHGYGCKHVDWVDGLLQLGECTCWKADVL